MIYLKNIFTYSVLLFVMIPFFVSAQISEPTGPGATESFVTCGYDRECTVNDLVGQGGIIQRALNWIFMFAGFIVAILFMYAGFLMISAGGDSGQITKAKNIFKNVIIGFIIMLVAVVAIQQLLTYIGASEIFKNIIQ